MAFYKKFERSFQSDGLYWLQMGLAYRSVGKHDEALQALETGLLLHPITHTRHALGQQKLINAAEKLNSGEREKAISSMDDGIRCLKELDNLDELVGGRYYPIVALSEGHVFLSKLMYGDAEAKALAKIYATEIANRLSQDGAVFRGDRRAFVTTPQFRAKRAVKRLNTFVLEDRWEFGRNLASLMTTDVPDSRID